MINENIAYAKSILNKQSITTESPEYQDYLKIREICGTNYGYIGILTKLRFLDNVTDVDELKSIFDVLKNTKIDIGKLNKLTYSEILDTFFNEFDTKKEADNDIELVYRDKSYSYYEVKTYEAMLKIGSPSWCLKTKSHWDRYKKVYDYQYVAIDNRYLNKLLSPNTNYLTKYETTKPWLRFGVSINLKDDIFSWECYDDNNIKRTADAKNHTSYGVIMTILNLVSGIKKSYFENFAYTNKYNDTYLKVRDNVNFFEYLKFTNTKDLYLNDTEVYVRFSKTYDESVLLLMMNDNYFYALRLNDENEKEHINLGVKDSLEVVNDYAEKSSDNVYDGIKLKLGKTTLDEIKAKDKFITIIDEKWAIFDRNDNYYLVVNLKLDDGYSICCRYIKGENANLKNPVFFYIDKHTEKTPYLTNEKLSNDIRNKIEIFLKESIKKTSEIKKDNEDDFKFFRRIKKFFDK